MKILHLATGTTQYEYNQGLSTLDAILEIEQHIQEGAEETHVLLMGRANAFGTISRAELWATLYKKGTPPRNRHPHKARTSKHQPLCKASKPIWRRTREQRRRTPGISNQCDNVHNLSR